MLYSELETIIDDTIKVFINSYDSCNEGIEEDAETYANRIAWRHFYKSVGRLDTVVLYLFDTVVKDRIHVARFGSPS